MSGEEFKSKLETFYNYLSENISEKTHSDYIEENYLNLKDNCI